MRKSPYLLMVLGCLFTFHQTAKASNEWEYVYYVPHLVYGGEFYPVSHGQTVLGIVSAEDGTSYMLDQDADGIFETQSTNLTAGTYEYFYRSNWPYPTGILSTGACLCSNKPLQVILAYHHNDFGTFDSGFMWTSLFPTTRWGNEFIIPVESTYQYLFAKENTDVSITPPGGIATQYNLPAMSDMKFLALAPGTLITASNPIYVIAVNCQPDQNFPWMCNVLPTIAIGNEYYFDTSYGPYDFTSPIPTISKIWLTSPYDGTIINLDENNDGTIDQSYSLDTQEFVSIDPPAEGAHIFSDNVFYLVNTEIWAVDHRGKKGGIAVEFLPVKSFGKEFAILDHQWDRLLPDVNPRIFIVSAKDNTQVNIDFEWDGIAETSFTINKGEVWKEFWPENYQYTAHVWSNKKIHAVFRTDSAHWDHPGVCVGYTAVPLDQSAPFGVFDTPIAGCTVSGSIPVTGWALDDIRVTRLQIKRNSHPDDPPAVVGSDGLVFIGDAVFVKGARPDVESIYSTYPHADRAGWGYMLLTNALPNNGNGPYTLHAFAYDGSGNKVKLGEKSITCDNANRIKPFGAIDTPTQGGIASGSDYLNFGWALTPQPKKIPEDGSTIWVWVDGLPLGHPDYGHYRGDIATKFPGYQNSEGAVGFYILDTTQYANGIHTIAWSVKDDQGEGTGIGARRFEIQNLNGASPVSEAFLYTVDMTGKMRIGILGIERGIKTWLLERERRAQLEQVKYANRDSLKLEIEETERIELHFKGQGGDKYIGWGKQLNDPLPIGTTLDKNQGAFYWQLTPGFLGRHVLHFAVTNGVSRSRPVRVLVDVIPKQFQK